MGEQAVQYLADAVSALVFGVASIFLAPTIFLLVLKRFMPILGNPLWQLYCQLLTWLIVGPIRLIRLLISEATGRRRR